MTKKEPERDYQLDGIDRRIIYALMQDARNNSGSAISETTNVTGATIRNRITQLEMAGILEGYHADTNFERIDGSLKVVFICHAPRTDIDNTVDQIGAIPNVINVRELLSGQSNLHVVAIGAHTNEIHAIAQRLEALNLEIEEQSLLKDEHDTPYTPYGPSEES